MVEHTHWLIYLDAISAFEQSLHSTQLTLLRVPLNLVRIVGVEPTRLAAPEPKSGASTNFAISA